MNKQDQFETNQPGIQSSTSENEAGAESLADLAPTGAQAEVTKGGNGGTARFPALFNNKGTTN